MRIAIGSQTVQIETKTVPSFKHAMSHPHLAPVLLTVDTAPDYAALLRTLQSTPRPFAVCLLRVK